MSQEQRKQFNILSDAIVAILIPIVGYYVAYKYENGYANYFRMPTSFIDVGLSEILRLIGLLVLLFFAALGYLDIRSTLFKDKNPIARAIGRILLPWGWCLLFVYIYDPRGLSLYFLLLVILLFPFTEFVLPLFTQRRIKGYRNKLESQEHKEETKRSVMATWLDSSGHGKGIFKYAGLVVLFISLFFIELIGQAEARYKSDYMVLKCDPELVVLRKYSNKLICAEFDRKEKAITNAFYLKNIDRIAEDGIKITSESIGPIKRYKVK